MYASDMGPDTKFNTESSLYNTTVHEHAPLYMLLKGWLKWR